VRLDTLLPTSQRSFHIVTLYTIARNKISEKSVMLTSLMLRPLQYQMTIICLKRRWDFPQVWSSHFKQKTYIQGSNSKTTSFSFSVCLGNGNKENGAQRRWVKLWDCKFFRHLNVNIKFHNSREKLLRYQFSVHFDGTGQLLIRYSVFVRYWGKKLI